MAQTQRKSKTTSFRWDIENEEEFVEAVERLQEEGKVSSAVDRSDAMRLVLNNWADDPDPEFLR